MISIRVNAMPTSGGQPGSTVNPAEWVDLHGDTLHRFALSRLRDAEAVEEVVQETFTEPVLCLMGCMKAHLDK